MLEQLAAEVEGELRVLIEILPHDPERGIAALPPQERAQPALQEEDAAVGLDEREGVQGRSYIRNGEGLVLEALNGPRLPEAQSSLSDESAK